MRWPWPWSSSRPRAAPTPVRSSAATWLGRPSAPSSTSSSPTGASSSDASSRSWPRTSRATTGQPLRGRAGGRRGLLRAVPPGPSRPTAERRHRGRDRQGDRRSPAHGVRPAAAPRRDRPTHGIRPMRCPAPTGSSSRSAGRPVHHGTSSRRIDVQSGALVRFANAGHEPPLLVPADAVADPRARQRGSALGMFADLGLTGYAGSTWPPGDLLLLYTDGVTDARAPSGDRFDDDRVLATLETATPWLHGAGRRRPTARQHRQVPGWRGTGRRRDGRRAPAPAGGTRDRTTPGRDGSCSTAASRPNSRPGATTSSDRLWSARVLLEDPAAIEAVHRAYFEAGADVATTASYQATLPGLEAAGLDRAAPPWASIRRSVTRLARRARDEIAADGAGRSLLVAGSVGPYGAMLADGSEYRGDYDPGDGGAAIRPRRRGSTRCSRPASTSSRSRRSRRCARRRCSSISSRRRAPGRGCRISVGMAARPRPVSRSRTRWPWPPTRPGCWRSASTARHRGTSPSCWPPPGTPDRGCPSSPTRTGAMPGTRVAGGGRLADGAGAFDADAVAGWTSRGASWLGGCCGTRPADIAGLAAALGRVRRPRPRVD